jgi:hypothetical protein
MNNIEPEHFKYRNRVITDILQTSGINLISK